MTPTELATATACWSCAAAIDDSPLLCLQCGKVQPTAVDFDYYRVFGLDRRLGLNTEALEKRFYQLSRRLHPDLFARASEQEQQWSLANSSLLNDAYRTLKDPIARTEYLLKIEGVQMTEGESSGKRTDPSRMPPDLLEEVFELNMQLEEMRMNQKMGEDDPTLRKDLEVAKTNFETQLGTIDRDLKTSWELWDDACDIGTSDIEVERKQAAAKDKMVALVDRRRYVLNLVRDVNQALEVQD